MFDERLPKGGINIGFNTLAFTPKCCEDILNQRMKTETWNLKKIAFPWSGTKRRKSVDFTCKEIKPMRDVCRFSLCLDRMGLFCFDVSCYVCCTLRRDSHSVGYNSAEVLKKFTVNIKCGFETKLSISSEVYYLELRETFADVLWGALNTTI